MNQNNFSADISSHPALVNFQNLLQNSGISQERSREHTGQLAEIVALAVLERIFTEKVSTTAVTEQEFERALAQYSTQDLNAIISQEFQSELQKYLTVIKSSLKQADQQRFSSLFGVRLDQN